MDMDVGIHINQVWHVETSPGKVMTDVEAATLAAEAGAKVIRYDVNWRDIQTSSDAAFDAKSFDMSGGDYDRYLVRRGYGPNGEMFTWPYETLKKAAQSGLKTIVNLNTMPDWAKRFPDEPYKDVANPNPRAFLLQDNRRLGEFIADFIVFCARKPNGEGLEVLKAIKAFQIFNEVGGWSQSYNPGYGFIAEAQLPYTEYLQILDHTMALVDTAFRNISFAGERPPVTGPNLAGTYTPAFWRAVARYVPVNTSTATASGKLRLEGISLHPYGVIVRPDVDVAREDAEAPGSFGINKAYENLGDHLTFNRLMLPTDDWISMLGLIDRDTDKSQSWGLTRFANVEDPARETETQKGYTADLYYDRNPELGVERTLALVQSLGLAPERVQFTEFGASAFRGSDGANALYYTNFADPYRYGYVPQKEKLSKAMAENLQAEAILQTIGLFGTWDFVDAATIFMFFDRGPKGHVEQFGIARNALRKNGKPDWSPGGKLYLSFMKGESFSLQNMSGKPPETGVDLHLAMAGTTINRNPLAHETIVLGPQADQLDGEAGDDIIFGSDGSDRLSGGDGYDRLYGGFGNDTLFGGAGNDRIKGDAGDDTMTGGAGRDNFVFTSHGMGKSGNSGHDVITDFDVRADRITLVGFTQPKSNLPDVMFDTADGVLLRWGANDATVLLRGVKAKDLSGRHFHLLN